jgi:glutamate-1-semialdehyde 2,1-aminomutase
MTTLGKIIGGGLPVGAYGGKKEIMEKVSPAGPVYQAGTLSGNPMAMAAGLAMLKHLRSHQEIYHNIDKTTSKIAEGMMAPLNRKGIPSSVNYAGSMFTLFFTGDKVTDYQSAKKSDTALFGRYFQAMLKRGIYLAPSQFEAMFVSASITSDIASRILDAHELSVGEL